MMHPAAVKTVKEVIKQLISRSSGETEKIANWVSMKI